MPASPEKELIKEKAGELGRILKSAGFTEEISSPEVIGSRVVVRVLAEINRSDFSKRTTQLPAGIRIWESLTGTVEDTNDGFKAIDTRYHKNPSFGIKL